MLRALLHGKARLRPNIDEPWSELDRYADREDVLTSFVFGTLLYLPAELLWNVLREAAESSDGNALPEAAGALTDAQFWPSWWLTDKDGLRRRVEPDLFLAYEACEVIVEAKRHDGQALQYAVQLARELGAYFHTKRNGKPVHLLAVGGLPPTVDRRAVRSLRQEVNAELASLLGTRATSSPDWNIEVAPWARLLRAVRAMRDARSLTREWRTILDDVGMALELYQTVDCLPTWLSDLPKAIGEHALAGSDWTKFTWRESARTAMQTARSSADWWFETAALRLGSDHSLRVIERWTRG